MLFNDMLVVETLLISALIFYINNTNLLVLLYTGGIYLILLGLLLLLNDADVFVGFLWVIDLGVGLVFFIFILHFTSFLYQKSQFNITHRFNTILVGFVFSLILSIYYLGYNSDNTFYRDLLKTWFFRLSNVDYYIIYNTFETSELSLLRDLYFFLNSFEFYIVNFSLLFGLVSTILIYFFIQRVFNFLNFSQIVDLNVLNNIDSGFFIKSQNFVTQQNTSGVTRVWVKTKAN